MALSLTLDIRRHSTVMEALYYLVRREQDGYLTYAENVISPYAHRMLRAATAVADLAHPDFNVYHRHRDRLAGDYMRLPLVRLAAAGAGYELTEVGRALARADGRLNWENNNADNISFLSLFYRSYPERRTPELQQFLLDYGVLSNNPGFRAITEILSRSDLLVQAGGYTNITDAQAERMEVVGRQGATLILAYPASSRILVTSTTYAENLALARTQLAEARRMRSTLQAAERSLELGRQLIRNSPKPRLLRLEDLTNWVQGNLPGIVTNVEIRGSLLHVDYIACQAAWEHAGFCESDDDDDYELDYDSLYIPPCRLTMSAIRGVEALRLQFLRDGAVSDRIFHPHVESSLCFGTYGEYLAAAFTSRADNPIAWVTTVISSFRAFRREFTDSTMVSHDTVYRYNTELLKERPDLFSPIEGLDGKLYDNVNELRNVDRVERPRPVCHRCGNTRCICICCDGCDEYWYVDDHVKYCPNCGPICRGCGGFIPPEATIYDTGNITSDSTDEEIGKEEWRLDWEWNMDIHLGCAGWSHCFAQLARMILGGTIAAPLTGRGLRTTARGAMVCTNERCVDYTTDLHTQLCRGCATCASLQEIRTKLGISWAQSNPHQPPIVPSTRSLLDETEDPF